MSTKNPSFFIFVSLLLSLALSCQSTKERTIEQEISELVASTIPSNAVIITTTDIQRSQGAVQATWELQTEWDWQQYFEWVRTELDTTYTLSDKTEKMARFRKITSGDSYVIELSVSDEKPLYIYASFTAIPF